MDKTECHANRGHAQTQWKAARAVTGCICPVCAQRGCEDDVVGTAMTSTEMDDDLHRSEKKRGGNMGGHLSSRKPGVVGGACRARNIMTRLVEVWQHISGLQAEGVRVSEEGWLQAEISTLETTGSGCVLVGRSCCSAVDIAMELRALEENEKCWNDRR